MKKSELLELKEKIEDTKADISKLEGRRDYLQQELRDEHDINSLKEASQKLTDLQEEINGVQEKIEQQIKKLKEKYLDE